MVAVHIHVHIAVGRNPKKVDLFPQTHVGTSMANDMVYSNTTNNCTCSREFCNCSIKAQVERYVNGATIDK